MNAPAPNPKLPAAKRLDLPLLKVENLVKRFPIKGGLLDVSFGHGFGHGPNTVLVLIANVPQ